MSNFIKSLITEDVNDFRTGVQQILAEKIINSLLARKSGIAVNLLEASDWILAFDFKSGDKKKVEADLKKRFKKYFSGSGSMGKGFDLSFHGPKNDLQKIKTYVEKTYKKDLNIKYTTFMAESVAFNEKHTASHEGSCDEVHPDASHEEWEEEQEGLDESKMSEFHMHVKEGKSAQQIARIMKIDIKTVKILMKDMKESYLYEASPKIKYAKIMKGIRDSQGPFSVVAIKNGKVVGNKHSIKNSKLLPIEVNDMADAHPGATISIESKGGKILNTFKESYQLDEVKWDKDENRIVPKWEKDLLKATSKLKGIVRGLKKGKEVQSYRTGGTMISGAVGVLLRDFGADTVELVVRGKVVYTVKKKDVMKNGKMIDESYLYERFGGDTNIPASKQEKEIIQNPKSKILMNVQSSLNKTARFVVIQRPMGHRGELRKNADKVLMATISDPNKGRIKMFAYHGSHVNLAGAKKFAKNQKLISTNTTESYLGEARTKTRTFEFPDNRKAKQFAKDISNSSIATGTVSGNRVIDVELLRGSPSLAKSAIAKYLKQNRGKELNESVISKIQESYTSKMPIDIDIDGKIIHVPSDVCEEIVLLHDDLNADNQIRLRELINEDIKSFVEISNFAKKRE